MHLHSDRAYIEHQFGCAFHDRFLMALRAFDNTKSVTPLLLEKDGVRFGLFLQVEAGNVEAAQLPPDIRPVYYQPYFNFDDPAPPAHASFVDAVSAIADGQSSLMVDPRLPIGMTRRLQERFRLSFEERPQPGTISVTTIRPSAALERLTLHRSRVNQIAGRVLERSSIRDRIAAYLIDRPDRRFVLLDELLADVGSEAVIASSIINVQELTGLPMRGKRRPLAVVYTRGGGIHVVEAGRVDGAAIFESVAGALDAIAPSGTIAVEEDDVETWLATELRLDRRIVIAGDMLLRMWRDRSTLPDLGAYIVTTRASRHAMEAALGFARDAVDEGRCITELDAYAVYLGALRGFFAEFAPDFRVARTLTNFHTGARTMFPSNPTHYPVTRGARTLKIDAGCLMMAPDGTMLGCSDIARTLCFDDAGQELLETFRDVIRKRLIPACAAGTIGHDIHALAVKCIGDARPRLSSNPLYADIAGHPSTYDRDVGHLLGRNNLAHLKFTLRENGSLMEGMVACCEYQWPGTGYAIAYEDTCLVASRSGLNLTED